MILAEAMEIFRRNTKWIEVDQDSENKRTRTEDVECTINKDERRSAIALCIKMCELQKEEDKSRNRRDMFTYLLSKYLVIDLTILLCSPFIIIYFIK